MSDAAPTPQLLLQILESDIASLEKLPPEALAGPELLPRLNSLANQLATVAELASMARAGRRTDGH